MRVTDWSPPQRRRVCRALWTVVGLVLLADIGIVLSLRDEGQTVGDPMGSPRETPTVDQLRPEPLASTLADYAAVWQRDVSTDFTPKPPPTPEPEPEPPAPPKLVLKAILQDAERPVAVVIGTDGKPIVLSRGIERRGLKLLEVQPHVAVVGYKGRELRLELPVEAIAVRIEEVSLTTQQEKRKPSRDPAYEMRLALAAQHTFLADVHVDPLWGGTELGRFSGLKVMAVRASSPYAEVGLKPQDVVHAVAGEPIATLDDVARLYDALLSGEELEIEIHRDEQTYWLVYASPEDE